jgi:hypothetical protein
MRVALALVAALAATPAFAADEPMATAGAVPAPSMAAAAVPAAPAAPAREMTTAEQIDAFLRSAPTPDAETAAVDGVALRDDRRVHGVVQVGVGTGGYRSFYAQTDMQLGDSGRLSLAFEDSRGPRGYGGYGGGYGGFRGPAPLGLVDRQRCDLEGMSAQRPLDVMGGPNGRCVSALRR